MQSLQDMLGDDPCWKFQNLLTKLTCLLNGRSEGDRQQLNTLFDELNALNFKTPIVTNAHKAVLIINQCCTIVPPSDTLLVAKGCQLISNLITKQQVQVEGKTLSVAVDWCIQSLKFSADIAVLDILSALECLLRGNGTNLEDKTHNLIGANGVLTRLLDVGAGGKKTDTLKLASPWEVHLQTLQCVEALVYVAEDCRHPTVQGHGLSDSCLDTCTKIFVSQLSVQKHPQQEEVNYCKVLVTSLRGLQAVLQQSTTVLSANVGLLVGASRGLMGYGLPGYSWAPPREVFPAQLGQADERASLPINRRGKVRTRKCSHRRTAATKALSVPEEEERTHCNMPSHGMEYFHHVATDSNPVSSLMPSWLRQSDSEYSSDAEGGQGGQVRVAQGRVRQGALFLLHTVCKGAEQRQVFGYWTSLLPAGPPTPGATTLVSCLLRDPSPRCRVLVISVLTAMLLRSKSFLAQADCSEYQQAFTPFSATLANMVTELHRALCLAVTSENSFPVLNSLLKCLALLVQNCPYSRLKPGLLGRVVRNVRAFLQHRDPNIQVACLTVLGSLASLDTFTPELTNILTNPARNKVVPEAGGAVAEVTGSPDEEVDPTEEHWSHEDDLDENSESDTVTGSELPWLLEVILAKLSPGSMLPVRIEALQVLAALARSCPSAVAAHIGVLQAVLVGVLDDADHTIRLHAGRAVDTVGRALQEEGTPTVQAAAFWQALLAGPLTAFIQSSGDSVLREVACDCLASIGVTAFDELPRDKQILAMTLLFGCSREDRWSIRSSAVRALTMMAHFPSLRQDTHFMIDVGEAVIETVRDENPLLRMKAAWSMGNYGDALLLARADPAAEDIPDELLLRLLEMGIAAADDKEKVRSSAVRSLGNFLTLVTERLIERPEFKLAAERAISALVRNAHSGSVAKAKIQWNACYAIGSVLKNDALCAEGSEWQPAVFLALTDMVQNFRNFKVRTNAALALSALSRREQYGVHFVGLWSALLRGLENADNAEDYSEYRHRTGLLDQLCLTLLHLAAMVTPADLRALEDCLAFHIDILREAIARFQERVVPERAVATLHAATHTAQLLTLPGLSAAQHRTAALLASALLCD